MKSRDQNLCQILVSFIFCAPSTRKLSIVFLNIVFALFYIWCLFFYWYWCCFPSVFCWWWHMSEASSNLMSSFWPTRRLCPLFFQDGSKSWIHYHEFIHFFVFLSSSLSFHKFLRFASWQRIGKKYCYSENQGSALSDPSVLKSIYP
jgi:hypothetical protein